MAVSYMLFTALRLMVRNSTGLAIADDGRLVPDNLQGSAANSTSYGAVTATPAGVKASQKFVMTVPAGSFDPRSVRVRAVWALTAAAGAGGTGRLVFEVWRNGAALATPALVNGPTRATDAGGPYTELVNIALPDGVGWAEGDTFEIRISFEVVAAVAGNVTITLNHNAGAAPAECSAQIETGL
jgi:hypothetical protein